MRLRPILMTSVATIMGALPIALGLGAGSASRRPLGYAIVGGLLFSTVLTLFLVPAVYVMLDLARAKVRRRQESDVRTPRRQNLPSRWRGLSDTSQSLCFCKSPRRGIRSRAITLAEALRRAPRLDPAIHRGTGRGRQCRMVSASRVVGDRAAVGAPGERRGAILDADVRARRGSAAGALGRRARWRRPTRSSRAEGSSPTESREGRARGVARARDPGAVRRRAEEPSPTTTRCSPIRSFHAWLASGCAARASSSASRERAWRLGSAVSTDSLQVLLELNRARVSELRQTARLRVSRLQLGRRVGIEGPVEAIPLADAAAAASDRPGGRGTPKRTRTGRARRGAGTGRRGRGAGERGARIVSSRRSR